MGLNLEDMRAGLRRATGTDVPNMPDDLADLYLNRSYWEILDKFHFREKDTIRTFDLTVGEARYEVPSPFEAVQKLSIEDIDTHVRTPLKRMSRQEYDSVFVNDADHYAKPEKYIREGCWIRLWPTPDKAYPFIIVYWTTLADLNDSINPAPQIPQAWHEAIEWGGEWRAFIDLGDHVRSDKLARRQSDYIASLSPIEAKEEYDSHTAGVAPIVREYDV